MKQRRYNPGISLAASLGFLVCAAILLSVVFSVYFYNMRMQYFYRIELRNELEMLAATAASQISSALYTGRYETVDEIMKNNIGRSELVTDALVVQSADGRVYYDLLSYEGNSREGEVYSPPEGDAAQCLSRPVVFNAGVAGGQPMDDEEIGLLVLCYREMDPLRRERLHAMVSLAHNMTANLSAAVDQGHFTKMRDIMVNIEDSSLSLEYSQLLNNDGMFLYYYEKGLSQEVMRAREGRKVADAAGRLSLGVSGRKPLLIQNIAMPGGKEVIDITVPIMRKNKRIGVARIGYSMEDFRAEKERTRRNLVAVTAALILAGLAAAVFFSGRVANSIRKLAAEVRLVGKGGYRDRRISIASNLREVRELEESFNEMFEKRQFAEFELQRRQEQLRQLATRVITAQEQERSRISKELHDELGHRLISLSLRLAAIRKKKLLPKEEIHSLTVLLEETSGEVMRIFRGLSPSFIDRLGLSEALTTFIEIFQSQNVVQIAADIDHFDKEDLPADVAINLFRIAQESFNNILKYAEAENVAVSLLEKHGSLELIVADDGRGMKFDWLNLTGGLGMIGMRERAHAMGGSLDVLSCPGLGTAIRVSVPLTGGEEGNKP